MKDSPKILITGGSGFIGGHVVKYFLSKGANVFCLIRKESITDFIKECDVKLIDGDITQEDSLIRAFKDMDCIIHTAGRSSDWGSRADFQRTNVDGTLNVLNAAFKNNIRKVIITGSISSYGEEHAAQIKNESSPYKSHYPYFFHRIFPSGMNYYRDSKAEATMKAIEFARENDINLSVIEPVWVYGENEFSSGFYEYVKTVKSGMKMMPGSGSNNFHVVYAGDLAEAYYRVFQSDLKGVERFIIGNQAPQKMDEIYSLFCLKAGIRPPVKLPKFLVWGPAFISELMATILRLKSPPALTRARTNMFYDNIGYSTDKAREVLSFTANTPLETGIEKTISWYKENQYL